MVKRLTIQLSSRLSAAGRRYATPLISNVRPQEKTLSFDIIVLQPSPDIGVLRSIEEVREVFPLGTPEEIQRQCNRVVSGIKWTANSGAFEAKEGFVLEFSIPDETRPTSLHLSLYFGESWEEKGSAAFDRLVHNLYDSLRWQSFAASDNSSLLIAEEE